MPRILPVVKIIAKAGSQGPPGADGADGSVYEVVQQTSASYTETDTTGIKTIECDCTSNAITINLATAVGSTLELTVVKTDSSANAITIDGFSSQTINGATTATITTQHQSLTIQSNGSGWRVV